jgi:putative redox protein
MKASILWMKEAQFIAQSDSGHTLIIDGPPDHGGKNLGARPMEMVLMGLGACTSIDVIDILKKSRQDITDCVTQLTAERASSIPAVFTKIHLHFVVTGRNLKSRQVERAIELSATKYCSAGMMLQRGGVDITHDYEIVAAAPSN